MVGARNAFSKLNSRVDAFIHASRGSSRHQRKTFMGLFHPQLHVGLSRRWALPYGRGFHEKACSCQGPRRKYFGGSTRGRSPSCGGAALLRRGGNPPAPAFPAGETGKGRSDSLLPQALFPRSQRRFALLPFALSIGAFAQVPFGVLNLIGCCHLGIELVSLVSEASVPPRPRSHPNPAIGLTEHNRIHAACAIPLFVVAHDPSASTSPAAFSAQYRLVLSPRSILIVRRSDLRIFVVVLRIGLFAFLIFFFMWPVSFPFALRVRSIGQLNASPSGRPAFSSHLGNSSTRFLGRK
jgi:hypothetical protein